MHTRAHAHSHICAMKYERIEASKAARRVTEEDEGIGTGAAEKKDADEEEEEEGVKAPDGAIAIVPTPSWTETTTMQILKVV